METRLARCTLRAWRETDARSLAAHADDRRIWLNLRDGFPHPYTIQDAEAFIRASVALDPPTRFAVEVDGKAVGSIGFLLQQDVERLSAEIGYWLGVAYWGRGIMTEALAAVTARAVERHGLVRVYATPYEWNPASCRVLEKAGYACEARMRRSAIKDGRVIDKLLYAYVVPESRSSPRDGVPGERDRPGAG